MREANIVRSLAEFLIGETWAHYDISSEGLKLLQDILFSLPEISGDDWEDLAIYWNTPIGEVERQRLGQRLLDQNLNEEQRQLVKNVLAAIVEADGTVGSEEASLLRAAGSALDRNDPQFIDVTERLLDFALPKRAQNMNANTGMLEAFFQEQILQHFENEFKGDAQSYLGLDEDELWKLIYTGTLMGRVAYADADFDEEEIATMRRLLKRDWGLSDDHSTIVTEFAIEAVQKTMDIKRLARHYYDLTTDLERLDFVDVMFDIARAAKGISNEEVQEIQSIATAIKVKTEDFEDAQTRAFKKDARRQNNS